MLVDGGSAHNFIQQSVAYKLGLGRNPTTPLKVIVGSGEELCCTEVCSNVDLFLQGHAFKVDLFILAMGFYP
jgi:hypothetical protein